MEDKKAGRLLLLLCALCVFAVNGLFLKAFSPLRRQGREGRQEDLGYALAVFKTA